MTSLIVAQSSKDVRALTSAFNPDGHPTKDIEWAVGKHTDGFKYTL